MDTDSIYVQSFPPVFQKSFVTHRVNDKFQNICNCVFGFAKYSKFLKFAMESLRLNYETQEGFAKIYTPYKTGPVFLTTMFVSLVFHQIDKHLDISIVTV